LELLKRFGANAWKFHNYELEYMSEIVEKELEKATSQVTELNKERKVAQVFDGISFKGEQSLTCPCSLTQWRN
jgi:pre-mRNA-splicing factor SPF27